MINWRTEVTTYTNHTWKNAKIDVCTSLKQVDEPKLEDASPALTHNLDTKLGARELDLLLGTLDLVEHLRKFVILNGSNEPCKKKNMIELQANRITRLDFVHELS